MIITKQILEAISMYPDWSDNALFIINFFIALI